MKLIDFLSLARKVSPCSGEFGLELETETKSSDEYPDMFFAHQFEEQGHIRYNFPELPAWVGHTDNSLRNFGHEFVLKKPLDFKEACTAIDDWAEVLKGVKFLKNAPATSTHVHINMANEEPMTLVNFLTLYTLFENVLTHYSGPPRRANLFALPIRVAERTYVNIGKLISGMAKADISSMVFQQGAVKYASLNLEPLTRIGSIEVRCFRGETNPTELKKWLKILNQLLVFSRLSGMNPTKILDSYRVYGIEFLDQVFDSSAPDILHTVDDVDVLIERNLWYAIQIAQMGDWVDFSKGMQDWIEKKKNKKEVSAKEMKEFLRHLGYSSQSLLIIGSAQLLELFNVHSDKYEAYLQQQAAPDTSIQAGPIPTYQPLFTHIESTDWNVQPSDFGDDIDD